MKPTSSLSASGQPVIRPRGTELLGVEGEIAIIIGRAARHVSPEQGLAHVGWFAPANDIGLYDLRWADRGSNLLSKGQDGFTPMGAPVRAAEVDPGRLVVRTRINGAVVQEDSTANLIAPFGLLVADLSRFMTLEPGDVILTGAPSGTCIVAPGDEVEVEVEGVGSVSNPIVEADQIAESFGAQPKITPATRAFALGVNAYRAVVLSETAKAALATVSTANVAAQLVRLGISSPYILGVQPARPDLRLVGYAYTLRCAPTRSDVRETGLSEQNAQTRAVDSIGPDEVLVVDARGEAQSKSIDDLVAARALTRGAAGIVTDGGAGGATALTSLDIPTYYKAAQEAAADDPNIPVDANVPIGCGGVLVMPGDVIVGDGDGVVVIPAALAERVARDALAAEPSEARGA